jgi:hypothetical protein
MQVDWEARSRNLLDASTEESLRNFIKTGEADRFIEEEADVSGDSDSEREDDSEKEDDE